MTGELIIDGLNVSTSLGILISQGGYIGLISFPEIKDLNFNDWAEQDGIEVDLTNVKIKAKVFEIDFVTKSRNANIDAFIDLITDGAYHVYNFPGLGITKTLRLVAGGSFNGASNELRSFTLKFSEDIPMLGYEYSAPVGGRYPEQGYSIDLIDLSQYGIAVLEGTEAEILKVSDVKKNIEIDNSNVNGVIYDPMVVRFKSKDVRLNLLMSGSGEDFIVNLNALMYNLTRQGERVLACLGKTYKCYFVKSEITYFDSTNPMWMEFGLVLKIISKE